MICGQSMQTSTCAGLRAHRTPGAGDATRQQGSPLGLGTEEAGRGSPPARHKSECCHGHITLLQGKHHKAFLKIHILKKKKNPHSCPQSIWLHLEVCTPPSGRQVVMRIHGRRAQQFMPPTTPHWNPWAPPTRTGAPSRPPCPLTTLAGFVRGGTPIRGL